MMRAEVKDVMIRALQHAGIVDDRNSEKWQNKTAEELAGLLASSGVDASSMGGNAVLEAALRLADRIAQGDSQAARELVATDAVARVDEKARELGDVALDDDELQQKTKGIIMEALVAAGIVHDPSSALWANKTAEELADVLASSAEGTCINLTGNPTLDLAVQLADRIAKGDSGAARELVAADVAAILRLVGLKDLRVDVSTSNLQLRKLCLLTVSARKGWVDCSNVSGSAAHRGNVQELRANESGLVKSCTLRWIPSQVGENQLSVYYSGPIPGYPGQNYDATPLVGCPIPVEVHGTCLCILLSHRMTKRIAPLCIQLCVHTPQLGSPRPWPKPD